VVIDVFPQTKFPELAGLTIFVTEEALTTDIKNNPKSNAPIPKGPTTPDFKPLILVTAAPVDASLKSKSLTSYKKLRPKAPRLISGLIPNDSRKNGH